MDKERIDKILYETKGVNLVVASKYVDSDGIRNLFSLGLKNFGENRVDAFLEKYNNLPINCLFAAFRDKNIDGMLSQLNRDCNKVTITTFDHKRARTKDEYFLYLFDYDFAEDWKSFVDDMIINHKEELNLVTGSLAFISLVRKYVKEKYNV